MITNVDNCVDIWQTARVTDGVSCMILRGGSSKGAYFLAHDLPSDALERDALLLRIMGSPDARQIDGIGGAFLRICPGNHETRVSRAAFIAVHFCSSRRRMWLFF